MPQGHLPRSVRSTAVADGILAALSTRRAAVATAITAGVGTLVAIVAASPVQQKRHLDHIVYEATIAAVRRGTSPYEAFVTSMDLIGADVDQARVMREPWLFEILARFPSGWLQPAFFLFVVLGSTLLAIPLVRVKPIALFVGAWLAMAGVFYGVDAWLLFELWTVPFLLAACLAYVQGHDGWAAAACFGAFCLRETAVLLLVGFLIDAAVRRRALRPWLVSLAACTAVLAIHWVLVQDHLEDGGRSAPLNDTGDLLAVLKATSFLVAPWAVGFAVWALGLYCLWHSRLRPAVLMAAIPLTGLVFDRPYWGWLAMPLCIVGIGRVLGRGATGAASPMSPARPHPEARTEPGAAPASPPSPP